MELSTALATTHVSLNSIDIDKTPPSSDVEACGASSTALTESVRLKTHYVVLPVFQLVFGVILARLIPKDCKSSLLHISR